MKINRDQLLEYLKDYCFNQSDSLSVDLFGILFFEKNPIIRPFFVFNTIEANDPLLEIEKIPWKQVPHFRDTIKIDTLKRNSPENETMKSLTGFSLKSVVIVPLFFGKKVMGVLIAGNRIQKNMITEGAKVAMEMASFHVSEEIKKTAGLILWQSSMLLANVILDYRINKVCCLPVNPDIMVSILQAVVKLRRLMVVREDGRGGARYYYAEIDKTRKITHRDTGPFNMDLLKKIHDDSFIRVPIVKDKNEIGFILLNYEDQESVFNEDIVGIIRITAPRLSEFLL